MKLRNKILALSFFGSIIVAFIMLVPFVLISFGILRKQNKAVVIGSTFFKMALPMFGIKPIVEGLHNIPKGRNFVVLSNHQSFLDIGVILHEIHPLAFLAKAELFKIPVFGYSLKFIGCIPIDRANRHSNRNVAEDMRDHIQRGFNYCVYPEGTRSVDGKLLPFKNGIFKIIQQAPVPVLPVTVCRTGDILPKKGMRLHPNRPRIVIHPMIEAEQIEKWNLEEFKTAVRNRIQEGLDLDARS